MIAMNCRIIYSVSSVPEDARRQSKGKESNNKPRHPPCGFENLSHQRWRGSESFRSDGYQPFYRLYLF